MSYDLNTYLSRSNMPAPEAWRAAIIAAEFPVDLDVSFDVDTFTGFLPSPVNGEMSGFEYYSRRVDLEERQELGVEMSIDFTIQFGIGSRPLELISALSAASVLASLSGGVLVDPQSGEFLSSSEAIFWARQQISLATG